MDSAMGMTMDTRLGIKQAALVLHGLGPADRDWLLAQLPSHQHQALHEALAELQALGIPRDAALTRTAAAAARPEPDDAPEPEGIDAASLDALASVLDGRPAGVVRAAVQLLADPARESLRAALGVAGSDEPTARLGPAFRASLSNALMTRLPASPFDGMPRMPAAHAGVKPRRRAWTARLGHGLRALVRPRTP